jgi:hypothetical protein
MSRWFTEELPWEDALPLVVLVVLVGLACAVAMGLSK